MEISFHLGAHCTDEDRLIKALLKNKRVLAQNGIAIPGPRRYRPLLRETLGKLRGAEPEPQLADAFRKHILGGKVGDRLVLACDILSGAPRFALGPRQIYPQIGDRVIALQRLFPNCEMQFSLGLRNPATFVPALYRLMQPGISFKRLIEPIELNALRWSETISAMRNNAPHAKIVTWANEDIPLIWPEILQAVSGHSNQVTLLGTEDIFEGLIKPAGMERLRAYFNERTDLDRFGRRKISDIFLNKFVDPNAVEESFDLPEWSEALLWELTRSYELDLERIAELPNIVMIGSEV